MESTKPVGMRLIELGWSQGSTLPGVGRVHFMQSTEEAWSLNRRDTTDEERLVVVTQDCDILSPIEDLVEAMPLYWTSVGSPQYDGAIQGNSRRYFLAEKEGLRKSRRALVVDATDRALLAKTSLLSISPSFVVPDDRREAWTHRFRLWLGSRYSSRPLGESVVEHVQKPVLEVVKELTENGLVLTEIVREVRFEPVAGAGPFDLHFKLLLEDGVDPSDEKVAELKGSFFEKFSKTRDGTRLAICDALGAESMSLHDYEHTWKLPLDSFTWYGEILKGSAPFEFE